MEKMNYEVKCKDQHFQNASGIMATKLEAQFYKPIFQVTSQINM